MARTVVKLAYMGFGVGAGGTVSTKSIGPIIGTLMAITSAGKVTPDSTCSISPIAVAIQFVQTLHIRYVQVPKQL